MEKRKRWQLFLIIAVVVLTIYNILPTVFYYSKPLKSPIDEARAESIALNIVKRVNSLEEDSREWLFSYSNMIGIKPQSINIMSEDSRLFEVVLQNSREAELFKKFLPRAGTLISFVPSQLDVYHDPNQVDPNKVLVQRQIGVHLDPNEVNELFHFFPKYDLEGKFSEDYKSMVIDRTTQIAVAFGGPSLTALQTAAIADNPDDPRYDELVISMAKEIIEVDNVLGRTNPITKRYYASFTQIDRDKQRSLIESLMNRMEKVKSRLDDQRKPLMEESDLETASEQKLALLTNQRNALEEAVAIIRKNSDLFKSGETPLNREQVYAQLITDETKLDPKDPVQILSMEGRHPFIESLVIDWSDDTILTRYYNDVAEIRDSEGITEAASYKREKLNQFIINDIARVSRLSDETVSPSGDNFAINLNTLTNPQSYLAFNLGTIAEKQTEQITNQLQDTWNPTHPDLVKEVFPIHDYNHWKELPAQDQKLGLVVYAPSMFSDNPPRGFKLDSIYVVAKGLNNIVQKYQETPDAPNAETLQQDLENLKSLLEANGFIGYPGNSFGIAKEFQSDYIFEVEDYYSTLLKATREDFTVKGSKREAILDFTDVEQRILTLNKIEDRMQEDLLKWKEEYQTAQVDLDPARRYEVPPLTKNPYWENLKISFFKYFRGDERNILKWGLDLSGGKTVRIGLHDHNNRPVTNPEDLNQAVNELYTRINKMGVSERTIRIENDNIILEFPGSQNLSASELIKASSMSFHIVNEKFSRNNPQLREAVQQFLQNVWNEAVVTNRKDIQSINEIAWEHLGGDERSGQMNQPRSEYAKLLYEQGMRIANPREDTMGPTFNDTLSSIAILRGEDFSSWEGQTNPLMIVFHNYALEGSSLTSVQVGYDPTEGNTLSFGVKGSYDKGSGSPRDDLYAWTSHFAEDKISGTPKEEYSGGRGWRMAVILNGSVISSPALRASLRDGGMISGRFSQREINQLASDLKAGSLSFTPVILSEQNISPELGKEERFHGIMASVVGLILVVVAMVGYYRFAGMVASCAVILNILIMWGVLQNLDAALTLPGIAGIVLTIGMAVDANVLVFERIREEFKISGRIGSAIQSGYRKAFSAIIDSNVTTIIAAIILIQFDTGPIKAFAVTLIIGIVSSMFTALFMTRYFFAGWIQKSKNKQLTMSEWIKNSHYDFLGKAKLAIGLSVLIAVVGGYFFLAQRNTLFGMDFTGGYSLTVELEERQDGSSYRLEAMDALLSNGATPNDIQVRELSKPNHLKIQLGIGMEEKGHPYFQLPDTREGKFEYIYENNPRIQWVVDSLVKGGLLIQQSDLETLDDDWTVMSGQFSHTMRNNAILALTCALISILIYITLRFEFKYAIGAVIGLTHDVVITMGILALLHKMGLPIQIDLEIVGAILTIIGYSLNDTIIVFDRIREDLKLYRKMKFNEIINHALNITLSRTLMTSGTTLLVLLALVLFGGSSIFGFSLVMTIGVVVGTLSSLFIAGPVMLFFHNREEKQELALKRA